GATSRRPDGGLRLRPGGPGGALGGESGARCGQARDRSGTLGAAHVGAGPHLRRRRGHPHAGHALRDGGGAIGRARRRRRRAVDARTTRGGTSRGSAQPSAARRSARVPRRYGPGEGAALPRLGRTRRAAWRRTTLARVAGEGRGGRSGASVRVRNVTRVLAPLVLLQALGCGATRERQVRRGEYEAVVAEVEGRRRPPTGRVARAYARALVAQGKSDAARDALVYAFRRGGDVRSLGLLGDLERDAGHPSMAALHYARAHDLDPGVFSGRSDVCRHFEARAQALVDVGEGRAAETFLRRSV